MNPRKVKLSAAQTLIRYHMLFYGEDAADPIPCPQHCLPSSEETTPRHQQGGRAQDDIKVACGKGTAGQKR